MRKDPHRSVREPLSIGSVMALVMITVIITAAILRAVT